MQKMMYAHRESVDQMEAQIKGKLASNQMKMCFIIFGMMLIKFVSSNKIPVTIRLLGVKPSHVVLPAGGIKRNNELYAKIF